MNTSDYLHTPDRWQAYSHPELANQSPEDLFDEHFASKYKHLHGALWIRILRVHGTLLTLEQLKRFPFEYIYAPNRMEFWRLVFHNFFDVAILLLNGLLNDQGDDTHTIRKFLDEIMQATWRHSDKKELFQKTLRERKPDKHLKDIAKRVRGIRNHFIAHQLLDKDSGRFNEAQGVDLKELWELFHSTHDLFGAVSFGSAYVTLAGDLMPGTVGGQPTRTCLDEVLDVVLRDSHFVNQPECEVQWWLSLRKAMDPKTLQVMNNLRERIGLPRA